MKVTKKFETAPISFATTDCCGQRVVYWLQDEKMNEKTCVYEYVTVGKDKYRYAQYDLSGVVELTLNDINEIAII
jgi:hypothetical protein